jgi:hypothetical protein
MAASRKNNRKYLAPSLPFKTKPRSLGALQPLDPRRQWDLPGLDFEGEHVAEELPLFVGEVVVGHAATTPYMRSSH